MALEVAARCPLAYMRSCCTLPSGPLAYSELMTHSIEMFFRRNRKSFRRSDFYDGKFNLRLVFVSFYGLLGEKPDQPNRAQPCQAYGHNFPRAFYDLAGPEFNRHVNYFCVQDRTIHTVL